MNISEKLTQTQFKEIMLNIYKAAQESENIELRDIIIEIQKMIFGIIKSSK